MTDDGKAKSYGEYLRLPELLALQTTLTEAHDELQFIVVHQVSELWFKLLLFELGGARDAMDRDQIPEALHLMRRVHEVLKVFAAGFDVIETMRPWDFLAFRERLQPASGFQSVQFREVEILSGLREPKLVAQHQGEDRARLERRMAEPSIWDAYVSLMGRHGLATRSHEEQLKSVIQILKQVDVHPLGHLAEALVEFDEQVSLWRSRHLKMTMRMIGNKPGTGQESVSRFSEETYGQMSQGGVEYLRTTLSRAFFPLLWEARTFVER